MSSTKDVWDAIDNKRDHSLPGWQFSCGLLGRVRPVRCDGGYVGEIPAELQAKALHHGLKIIGADYKTDSYIFEVMEKP